MIYTVTFNPSLDYIVDVTDFKTGVVNRTTGEKIFAGGKGINVSMVLKNLGMSNTSLGFTAGFTGNEIKRLLAKKGVDTDFIEVEDGISRINVKLRSNEESEINGQGPVITEDNIKKLYEKLDCLKESDVLVLAGSIPDVMPSSMYMDIMKHLEGRGYEKSKKKRAQKQGRSVDLRDRGAGSRGCLYSEDRDPGSGNHRDRLCAGSETGRRRERI